MDKKFELADQDQVFELDTIADKFFADILSMDGSEIMITDESWLSDFASYCGEHAIDYQRNCIATPLLTKKLATFGFGG